MSRRNGSWALTPVPALPAVPYLLLIRFQPHAGRFYKERVRLEIALKGEMRLYFQGGDVEDGYRLTVAGIVQWPCTCPQKGRRLQRRPSPSSHTKERAMSWQREAALQDHVPTSSPRKRIIFRGTLGAMCVHPCVTLMSTPVLGASSPDT